MEEGTYSRRISVCLGKPANRNSNEKSPKAKHEKWHIPRSSDSKIVGWLNRNTSGTLLITGYRGIGKTSSIDHAIESFNSPVDGKHPNNTIKEIRLNLTEIPRIQEFALLLLQELGKGTGAFCIRRNSGSPGYHVKRRFTLLRLCEVLALFGLAYIALGVFINHTSPKTLIVPAIILMVFACVDIWGRILGVTYLVALQHLLFRLESTVSTGNANGLKVNIKVDSLAGSGGIEGGTEGSINQNYERLTDSETVILLGEVIRNYLESERYRLFRPLFSQFWKKNWRLVITFDEIDKLKGFHSEKVAQETRFRDFEELLGKIKPILNQAGLTFIFIAGRETLFRWQMDNARGDSVYSSVFDHVIEIEPFLLGYEQNTNDPKNTELEAGKKVRQVVFSYLNNKYHLAKNCINCEACPKDKGKPVPKHSDDTCLLDLLGKNRFFNSFLRYLLWKSRGIPRKIIHILEDFIHSKNDGNDHISFDSHSIWRFKFYSGLVNDLYSRIVLQEKLDNEGILNLIALSETLFKFHRSGFNYADLRLITIAIDQDTLLKNEYYYDLAIQLLEGWLVEHSYGRKARYVFQPTIKAAIEILSHKFQDETVSFTFDQRDFRIHRKYFMEIDEKVEEQQADQRINSIRIQAGMGKIHQLIREYFESIEYYKKAIRIGNQWLSANKDSKIALGNKRLITRIMAESCIEIGYMLERKKKTREAMSFYSSAYLFAKISHDEHCHLLPPTTSLEPYFAIAEEAIDALTHMAFLDWKNGKIRGTDQLMDQAINIATRRPNPHKLGSLRLMKGTFHFIINGIDDAESNFELENTSQPTTPPPATENGQGESETETYLATHQYNTENPAYISTVAHEAKAFCHISKGEDLTKAKSELDKVNQRLEGYKDHRHLLENKLLEIKIIQEEITNYCLHPRGDFTSIENHYVSALMGFFNLIKDKGKGNKGGENKPHTASARYLYHFMDIFAWHTFTILALHEDSHTHCFLTVASRVAGRCSPLMEYFVDMCKDSFIEVTVNTKLNDSERLLLTKPGNGPLLSLIENDIYKIFSGDEDPYDCHGYISKFDNVFGGPHTIDLGTMLLFLEQIMLTSNRNRHVYGFSLFTSETLEKLGYFYFWIGSKKLIPGRDHQEFLECAERFLEDSLNHLPFAKKYLPDAYHFSWKAELTLGDIYFRRILINSPKNSRECIKHYSNALLSLAECLERCFCLMPLSPDVYFKEANLVPRMQMEELAFTRLRLKRALKFAPTEPKGFGFENDKVHSYCHYLRELANKLIHPDNDPSSTPPLVEELREALKPWRFFAELSC